MVEKWTFCTYLNVENSKICSFMKLNGEFSTKSSCKHKLMDRFSKFLSLNLSTKSRKQEIILYFETFYQYISEKSNLMLKMPLFLSNYGQFSVHKFEKSKFLARTWIEYFHMGIFVILWVYLIKKYGYKAQPFFLYFSFF